MKDSFVPGVGTRFSSGGHRGVVRWVGEVQGAEGLWLGVEWDDAWRGKHSGTHGGVSYFTSRRSNAASFIRPSPKLSFGSSFLHALRTRYIIDLDSFAASRSKEGLKQYSRKTLADIEVEAPNMASMIQKLSQLHMLREVGLAGRVSTGDGDSLGENSSTAADLEDYSEVSRAFDDELREAVGDIRLTCPNIKSLNLSRSLLPSWLELSKITIELPLLESLTLHFNRFADLSQGNMPMEGAFSQIKELRIDASFVSWNDIIKLSPHLVELESLQLGANDIRRLDLGEAYDSRPVLLSKLRSLNLEGNHLNDWSNIWTSLAICPNLERLVLSSNRISKIPTVTKRKPEHQKLQHISLRDNPISSWADLDRLDRAVGGLQSLVLGGDRCVLTSPSSQQQQQARLLAIARLATLQAFNGARVEAMERRDAELYYLSLVAKEGDEEDTTEQDRKVKHPRFEELCELHGKPIVRAAREQASQDGTLRSKLKTVSVHLSSEPPSASSPFGTAREGKGEEGANQAPQSSSNNKQVALLITTPLRLLLPKLARLFQLKRGAKSIESVWAVLSPSLDPLQETANILREEMRPTVTRSNASANAAAEEDRIIYQMDMLERDLQGYNLSSQDEIVLVCTE